MQTKKKLNSKNIKNKSIKNKSIKNKSIKNNYKPSIKILHKGFSLYAAKNHSGDKLLEYTSDMSKKEKKLCILDNSSWFGDYEVAKIYKTKTNHIYKWDINEKTLLLNINKKNEKFYNYIFSNCKVSLSPTIVLTQEQTIKIKKMNITNPYLDMNENIKALYEFKFAFGYLTLKEQYDFLKLIEFLIENKFINLETRYGDSILIKLKQKILYYNTNIFFKRKLKYNRLSFYFFDKYAIMNLCKIVGKQMNISGVYQKNDNSFWFPDFIIYKMNIKEYILFNPHENLIYDKLIN